MLIPFPDILAAADRIATLSPPTPLIRSEYFSRKLDADIFLKLEILNPTRSFKTRGAANAMLQLPKEQRDIGVVTASGGNHGLGLAYAAQMLDIPARIYLPETTPRSKVEDFACFDAETILTGVNWDQSNQSALAAANNDGLSYIHPFDDVAVMAGQGAIGLELAQDLPEIDAVVASIGGGGLIAGITSALAVLSPASRIYGVETIGADSMTQSFHNGQITTLPAITSIANTLGARAPGERHFEIMRNYASDVLAVSDAQAVAALLDILDNEKLLVEPAMSCSLAALTTGQIPVAPGENIVVIVCGGNVTLGDVHKWRQRFGV
ncbi:MAG: threonine/serine dehydratase [Chloroflexi bacterium]|nr:threonine/serine dehydratase [Chloroflexota bacterium]